MERGAGTQTIARNRSPRVRIDSRSDRSQTFGGRALWYRLSLRLLVSALPVAVFAAGGLSTQYSAWESFELGLMIYVGTMLCVGLLSFLPTVLSDLKTRRLLGMRYGVETRFGTASYQMRGIHIDNPPSDLPDRVETAMRAIHPSVVVARRDPHSVEGLRPGKFLEPVKSRVLARWEIDADGNALVTVESSPAELTSIYSPRKDLLYADHGRSLENVEEFQLALRREIEARALAVSGPEHGGNHTGVGL